MKHVIRGLLMLAYCVLMSTMSFAGALVDPGHIAVSYSSSRMTVAWPKGLRSSSARGFVNASGQEVLFNPNGQGYDTAVYFAVFTRGANPSYQRLTPAQAWSSDRNTLTLTAPRAARSGEVWSFCVERTKMSFGTRVLAFGNNSELCLGRTELTLFAWGLNGVEADPYSSVWFYPKDVHWTVQVETPANVGNRPVVLRLSSEILPSHLPISPSLTVFSGSVTGINLYALDAQGKLVTFTKSRRDLQKDPATRELILRFDVAMNLSQRFFSIGIVRGTRVDFVDPATIGWARGVGVQTKNITYQGVLRHGFVADPPIYPAVTYTQGGPLTLSIPKDRLAVTFWPSNGGPLTGSVQTTDAFTYHGRRPDGSWQVVQGNAVRRADGSVAITFSGLVGHEKGTVSFSHGGNLYWLVVPHIWYKDGITKYAASGGEVGFVLP